MNREEAEDIVKTVDTILTKILPAINEKQNVMERDIEQLKGRKTPNDGSHAAAHKTIDKIHTQTLKKNKEDEELQAMAKEMMERVKKNAKEAVEERVSGSDRKDRKYSGVKLLCGTMVKKAELKKKRKTHKKKRNRKTYKKKRTTKKKSK